MTSFIIQDVLRRETAQGSLGIPESTLNACPAIEKNQGNGWLMAEMPEQEPARAQKRPGRPL
jgi:hypothetical protein